MGLVALDNVTGERIDITQYINPHEQLYPNSYKRYMCQMCEECVMIRVGEIKIPHFAHYPSSKCSYGAGESFEHLLAKTQLAEYHRNRLSDVANVEVMLEWRIKTPTVHRVADIAVICNEWITIIECQLAHITVEDLEQRTKDYWEQGYEVIWAFGGKAGETRNLDWCRYNIGYVQLLNIDRKYNIY